MHPGITLAIKVLLNGMSKGDIYEIRKVVRVWIGAPGAPTGFSNSNYLSFFRTQPGIELGHPRTLYPDNVIRNTIGHVGHLIYVVKEVLFIYHTLLTLHIYAIYIYIICI